MIGQFQGKILTFFQRGWFLSVPVVLLFSCSIEKADVFSYSEFQSIDSLEVTLPVEYLAMTSWTTYNSDENTFFVEYGLDTEGNLVIHQIDFDRGKYLTPIVISREGPNGFNSSAASVYFKGQDSVFVFPASSPSFFLYNANGEKVKVYNYNSSHYDRYFNNGFYSSLVFRNELMIMTTVNDTRYDDREYFGKVSPIQFYDTHDSGFIDKIDYPSFVKGKFVPSNISNPMLSQINEDEIVINYSFSDSIYIYNLVDRTFNNYYCGSDAFGKPKLLNKVPDRQEEMSYHLREVNYELGFYHQGKIYRVVSHLLKSKYRDYSAFEIVNEILRGVTLVEMDLETGMLKYYEMPIAKYFVFDDDHLIVGGVSIREDGPGTYRKFYKYTLN